MSDVCVSDVCFCDEVNSTGAKTDSTSSKHRDDALWEPGSPPVYPGERFNLHSDMSGYHSYPKDHRAEHCCSEQPPSLSLAHLKELDSPQVHLNLFLKYGKESTESVGRTCVQDPSPQIQYRSLTSLCSAVLLAYPT